MDTKQYYSIPEVARLMGVSRIYLYGQVKRGIVKAIRVGRNFAIAKEDLDVLQNGIISDAQKTIIAQGVKRTVMQYGDALEKFGNE